MSILVVVLTLVLLAAVIVVISRPLLTTRDESGEPQTPRRGDLQAAREAKYREIRDTELDYRTGKLSKEDFETVNDTLRAEAVEILDQLDALGREPGEDQRPESGEG